MRFPKAVPTLVIGVALLGCENQQAEEPATPGAEARAEPQVASQEAAKPKVRERPMASAAIGKPAPEFSLKDLSGKEVSLSDHKGKVVVLEWFNPECPYVKLSHTKGSLKGLAKRYEKQGVVWLAINSGGEGRQGAGIESNRQAIEEFELQHPLLLDTTGRVGKAYAATNTPHLFVIDKQGTLVYRGAIDNSPDGEGQAAEGGKLVNYVTQALEALEAGNPVSVPETKAYGCGVKYAKS